MPGRPVVLFCMRVQDVAWPGMGVEIETCVNCRVEVWVGASSRAAMEARAREEGSEVIILCGGCGQTLLDEQEGERIPLSPDELRDLFYRRQDGNR